MTYEYEGKTEKEAIEIAANELNLDRDQFDVEILETQKTSLFKKGYVKIRVHTLEEVVNKKNEDDTEKHSRIVANPLPQGEFEQKLLEFITNLIEKMGYDIKVSITYREDKKIGIKLDSENYRIRREESLVRLAYSTADKVRSNKTSILLEPMNPFERRLIHTTLNDIPDVETKSEGDGLYKQVRVLYKGLR